MRKIFKNKTEMTFYENSQKTTQILQFLQEAYRAYAWGGEEEAQKNAGEVAAKILASDEWIWFISKEESEGKRETDKKGGFQIPM